MDQEMLFKDISHLNIWEPLCSAEWNHYLSNFGRMHHENLKLVVKEEMPVKAISYLELWQPFCSGEQNCLCNFGRGCYEEQCCEIILNLGHWFRRCLKYFLSRALAALLFDGAGPIMQFGKRASWAVILFGILGSYLFLHIWENILLKLGK